MNLFLDSCTKQFLYYKHLGDKTLAQVADDKLNWRYNEDSNSLATLVKHLWGNMLSRWTDFLESDGEKEWREREAEFDNDLPSREAILQKWEEGWKCLFDALSGLTDKDLERTIYIRNQGHSVQDAILRQLAHYSYHVGQIVYLGKILCGESWQSLSIPRGGTKAYNEEKFGQEKRKEHFTDEILNKNTKP